MAGTGEDQVLRRKRLRFRAWQRGTREMDLVLGRFVDARIDQLSDEDVGELERLMEEPDCRLAGRLSNSRSRN